MGLVIQYDCAAFNGFDSPVSAVNERNAKARINKGLVFRKAKVVSLNKFRLAGLVNRTLFNSGFFASTNAVRARQLYAEYRVNPK